MKKNIMALLLIVMGLSFCGKKGPLVLEPGKTPPAVTGLKLRQVGNQIELQWKFPALLSDRKTPLLPEQIRGVAVYHLAKPFNPETFMKKSELLARPKAGEIQLRGDGSSAFAVQFKVKMLQDKEHAFALTYQYGRSHSALSAIEKITTRIPPEPVRDLNCTREGKVVVLKWNRPQADSEGQPLQALAGYRVYRRIVMEGKVPEAFEAISEKVVKGEYYEDHDTGADGEYEYQVSSLLSERIESAPSAVFRIRIQDTFPPDVPANLVAFSAKDHVFLTWEAVRDRDLAHYSVYRRSAKEDDFKLLDATVTDNFYRDRQVVKGQMYVYTVVAVDRKGNESEPSRAVRQFFE
jgi:predicted small lipoprotein YifL